MSSLPPPSRPAAAPAASGLVSRLPGGALGPPSRFAGRATGPLLGLAGAPFCPLLGFTERSGRLLLLSAGRTCSPSFGSRRFLPRLASTTLLLPTRLSWLSCAFLLGLPFLAPTAFGGSGSGLEPSSLRVTLLLPALGGGFLLARLLWVLLLGRLRSLPPLPATVSALLAPTGVPSFLLGRSLLALLSGLWPVGGARLGGRRSFLFTTFRSRLGSLLRRPSLFDGFLSGWLLNLSTRLPLRLRVVQYVVQRSAFPSPIRGLVRPLSLLRWPSFTHSV